MELHLLLCFGSRTTLLGSRITAWSGTTLHAACLAIQNSEHQSWTGEYSRRLTSARTYGLFGPPHTASDMHQPAHEQVPEFGFQEGTLDRV